MSETVAGLAVTESRTVQTPGGRLHVRDYPGQGPALVMMHGFRDDSRIYDRVARCSPAAVVMAVDWLSYGRLLAPEKD